MVNMTTGRRRFGYSFILPAAGIFLLSGCAEGTGTFDFLKTQPSDESQEVSARTTTTTTLVERDVEAPDVFQATESGLWDGRPSLGGVWVAHPDVKQPERVIIRNTANSKFVIGALFKRERQNPGPKIQVSSDAADALGMLAGSPSQLNITALRREEKPTEQPPAAVPVDPAAAEAAPTEDLAAASAIETQALDPIAGAAAAIEEVEATPVSAPAEPAATAATPVRTASTLSKPFIQIGIFSVEQNAKNTATAMRQNGMTPTILAQKSSGKSFWRVIVGPANTTAERSDLLTRAKGMGFADAYAVTN